MASCTGEVLSAAHQDTLCMAVDDLFVVLQIVAWSAEDAMLCQSQHSGE